MGISEEIKSVAKKVIKASIISKADLVIEDFEVFKTAAKDKVVFLDEEGVDLGDFIYDYCSEIEVYTPSPLGHQKVRDSVADFIEEELLNNTSILDYVKDLKRFTYLIVNDGLKMIYLHSNVNEAKNQEIVSKINKTYKNYIEEQIKEVERNREEQQARRDKVFEKYLSEYKNAKSKNVKNQIILKAQHELKQITGVDGRAGGMTKMDVEVEFDYRLNQLSGGGENVLHI